MTTFSLRALIVTSVSALTLATATATASHAAKVAVLQDGKSIAIVDTDKKAVTGSVTVDAGATLIGIDVRPADGMLYGVTPDGVIVTIDPATGKWAKKSQLSEKLPAGAQFTVDFNPVADRMRLIASTGMNLRINVEDGKATVDGTLKYAETDKMKGMSPKVTAGAYTKSVAGTKETALYDIDAAHGVLVKQAPPNDGILVTVGPLGVKVDGVIAFDISTDAAGADTAWLISGGTLHTVDLASGAAKPVMQISGLAGSATDMAVLPSK